MIFDALHDIIRENPNTIHGAIMSFLNFLMSKNQNDIVFKTHPFIRGHAQLIDSAHLDFVRSLGFDGTVDSREFESLQEVAQKHNKDVLWIA